MVHENIKRPCFETKDYYPVMFTVEELEAFLSELGPIDYYRSSDILPMRREDIGELTVFRVLQKSTS